MAKIWKSKRKLHKTCKEKYKDAMKNFYSNLSKSNIKQDLSDIRNIEERWLALGGKKSMLYRIGIKKAVEVMEHRIDITAIKIL